jgi:hypothetical protein
MCTACTEEAEILRQLAAHAANSSQQIAALRLVDQRHEPVADFEADDVDGLHVFPRQLARFGRRRRCWRRRVSAGSGRLARR